VKRSLRLVPLFFKKELLENLKELLENFEVQRDIDYLGQIRVESHIIPFGISPNGYVTCWIGDINDLPNEIIDEFKRYLIFPDRLGKHFFKSQIQGEFVDEGDPN